MTVLFVSLSDVLVHWTRSGRVRDPPPFVILSSGFRYLFQPAYEEVLQSLFGSCHADSLRGLEGGWIQL